jgi:cell division septum initiation protein DivIVA
MPINKLTPEIITAAIEGFESQKRRLDDQIAELRAMLPGGTSETVAATEAPGQKRRRFSAAARRRMKEGQQRRWAKIRGGSQPSTTVPALAPKPKRKLSAAAKAKLVANLKKARAAKAAKAKAAVKKAAPDRKKAAAKKAATKRAPVSKKTGKAPAPSTTPAG